MRCESPKHPTAHPRPSDSKASYTHEKGLTRRRRLAIGFLAAAGLATAGAVLPRAPRRAHRHQGRPHGGAPPERPPSRRRRRRREGQRRGVPRREAGSAGLGVVEGPHVGERGLGGSGGRGSGRRDGVEKGSVQLELEPLEARGESASDGWIVWLGRRELR